MNGTKELYQPENIIIEGRTLLNILKEIKDKQEEIIATLDRMDKDYENVNLAVEAVNKAFPGGDLEGHRRYHAAMIERNADIRRLKVAVQERTLIGLVWLLLVFVGFCLIKGASGGTESFFAWFNGGYGR